MHLRGNEHIEKVYRHHYLPFIFQVLGILVASFPFYFIVFALESGLRPQAFYISLLVITLLFILVFLYAGIIYWADRLVITNFRVIHINWKLLHVSSEENAEISDIQNISVKSRGVLSFIPFLDYGTIAVETAASQVSIHFALAPNPQEIKRFILSIK